MDATFFTTNIVPQGPNNNQRGWEWFEAYCRDLTRDGHVLWICCGPAGVGGEGKEGRKDVIGKGRIEVTVPAKVWKVVLVLPNEDAKPTRATRTIVAEVTAKEFGRADEIEEGLKGTIRTLTV